MRVSYKLDYALKILFHLALYPQGQVPTIQALSLETDIPRKFLEQILLALKKAGFTDSKRGKDGGYFLVKEPSQIQIGDVIRAIEGPIEPIECLNAGYKGCSDIPTCLFRPLWQKVHTAVSEIVDNVSLADMIQEFKRLQAVSDYSI